MFLKPLKWVFLKRSVAALEVPVLYKMYLIRVKYLGVFYYGDNFEHRL